MAQPELPALEQYVAIDCEMVGAKSGQALARIAIVNHKCEVVYESYVFVHPQNVVDHRTSSSGIEAGDLAGAPTFEQVQAVVKAIIQDTILVGHALFNDLAAIGHRHPYELFRDTALNYPPPPPPGQKVGVTREGQYPSLKRLSKEVLGIDIQMKDGHDPVEDAKATMGIFLSVREAYEVSLLNDQDVVAGIPEAYIVNFW